jgi:putative transposase
MTHAANPSVREQEKFRRALAAFWAFLQSLDSTGFDYTFDRIEHLEREVGRLKEELRQSRNPGWLYLAVVMDLFSRKIVGWAAKQTIHRELVLKALTKAIRCRRPRKALIHSDQGTQYGSDAWRRFCKANRLEPSMSRRGNCWDNAVAESFFSSLKKERIKKRIYADRQSALLDIYEYIEGFYNPTRRHSYLGGVSPNEFEAAHRQRRSGVH